MPGRNLRPLLWGLFVALMAAGIAWAIWQYRLCMATIGDFWYCIQHAT